jgi:hypothetical protein
VISDQFVGLANALLATPGSAGSLASPPAVLVVPYPVSGIEHDAVVAKATDVLAEAARLVAAKLGESPDPA